MSKKILYWVSVVAVLVSILILSYFFFFPLLQDSNEEQRGSLLPSRNKDFITPSGYTSKVHEIIVTSEGFAPNKLTIALGDTIRFENQDSVPHWPASDPHPTHTGLYGFDALGNLATSESFSYVFTELGSYFYHDHTSALAEDLATPTGFIKVKLPSEL